MGMLFRLRPRNGAIVCASARNDLYKLADSFCRHASARWTDHTYRGKVRDLYVFLNYIQSIGGRAVLSEWTPDLTAAFLDHVRRNYAENTVNHYFITLCGFAKWLVQSVPGFVSPMTGVARPRPPAPTYQGLTPEEQAALRMEAQRRAQDGTFESFLAWVMFEVYVSTSLRLAEVRQLRVEQVAPTYDWLLNVRCKGPSYRDVLILEEARMPLRVYLHAHASAMAMLAPGTPVATLPLFPRLTRGRFDSARAFMRDNQPNEILRDIGRAVGIDVTSHKLRHTTAHNLLSVTGNLRDVARQLGHKRLETTMRYTEASNQTHQQRIEAAWKRRFNE